MQQPQLPRYEWGGATVARPARDVDAVEGLVEEGAEACEGGEDEGRSGGEENVCWRVGTETEVEGLCVAKGKLAGRFGGGKSKTHALDNLRPDARDVPLDAL